MIKKAVIRAYLLINRYSTEIQAVLSISSLNSMGCEFRSLIIVSSKRPRRPS